MAFLFKAFYCKNFCVALPLRSSQLKFLLTIILNSTDAEDSELVQSEDFDICDSRQTALFTIHTAVSIFQVTVSIYRRSNDFYVQE